MGIIKTIVYALAALMAITFLSAIVGAFVFGMGAGISERADSQTTPNDLNVNERITLNDDGRNGTVKCKHLTVTGNSKVVIIKNTDIETITITGSKNSIAYLSKANPEIVDHGNNNSICAVTITKDMNGNDKIINIVRCQINGQVITPAATTPKVTATPTPMPDDPDVKEGITLVYDGRSETIKCKHLTVTGNTNSVIIENDDIERITVLGDGNAIAYPGGSNPEIRDYGNYNSVWGSIWI